MIRIVSRFWWVYALRGIFAILFGIAALFWPGLALTVLVLLFSAYVLVQGIFLLIAAFGAKEITPNWRVVLLEGIISVLIGIIAFAWPDITAMALLAIIAIWAFISGIVEIYAAVQLRKAIEGEWILGLAGILSIIFAIILIVYPAAGALAVLWIIGFYAILFGILTLYLAFKIRKLPKNITV